MAARAAARTGEQGLVKFALLWLGFFYGPGILQSVAVIGDFTGVIHCHTSSNAVWGQLRVRWALRDQSENCTSGRRSARS